MSVTIRVLVVDDEADIRLLLRGVLHTDTGFDVVGEAASGTEAISKVRELKPDVVVLDYRMPDLTGLEVAEVVLAEFPDQRIVLFSAFLNDDTIHEALDLGVRACLSKDRVLELADELVRL